MENQIQRVTALASRYGLATTHGEPKDNMTVFFHRQEGNVVHLVQVTQLKETT